MANLSLSWFGSGSARIDDNPIQFRTRKAEALLIYLTAEAAIHGGAPTRREALLGLLWPDYPQKSARQSLRTNLSYLRTALLGMEQMAGVAPFLVIDSRMVQINLDAGVALDVDRFVQLLAEIAAHVHEALVPCAECRGRLERAAELYAGDFLEEFYLPDSAEFEAWVSARREAFRRQALDALDKLTEICIAQAELEAAEAYARRQLTIDPLRESAHRQLMTSLAQTGQRPAAVSHYEAARRRLNDELGIEPAVATTALYQAILDGELDPEKGVPPAPVAPSSVPESHQPETTVPAMPAWRHNLPPQPTPFVGRQEELGRLAEYLADPQVRLITIAGPGGMGKTRLATAAAEQIVAERADRAMFADGVCFVPLAPLDAAGHIAQAIATALDVGLPLGGDIRPLLSYLRRKQLLLILDNFEHLLDGADMAAEILQAAPGVKIIATSRERLQLREEQVFPIEGLGIPGSMLSERLLEYTAITLFLQTARRVQPGFSPDESELAILAHICQRLDGMPLAIELAAAWADAIPLADIAAELRSSLDLLESEMRDLPARHRSMRAIFDASWGRLGQREQTVLGRLCPFRGGFSRQAAQKVAGATLSILSRLVNKSLLHFQPADQRYHVHELLRQYSDARMSASGELELTRDAHSDYFLSFVCEREEDMKARRQAAAFKEISTEFENVRAAWQWAAKRKNLEAINRSLESLIMVYCGSMLRFDDAIALRQQALAALAPAANEKPHPAWYRLLARHLRSREDEIPQIENALAFAVQQGNRAEIAHCTGILGWASAMTGDSHTGIPLMEKAIRLYRELEDNFYLPQWYFQVAFAYRYAGKTEQALAAYKQSLALHRKFDDLANAVRPLTEMVWCLRHAGRFAESEARLRELCDLTQELDLPIWVAERQLDLAFVSFLKGDFEATESLIQQAISVIGEAGGNYTGEFEQGLLANLHGHHDQAWQLYETLVRKIVRGHAEFNAPWGLSLTACSLGKCETAKKQLQIALRFAVATNAKGYVALTLPVVALLYARLERAERAVELLALGRQHLADATGWLDNWLLFVRLQDDIESHIGRTAFAAAWERGQQLDLWPTAKQLLGELAPDEM